VTLSGACMDLNPVYPAAAEDDARGVAIGSKNKLAKLDKEMANLLQPYQDQVKRLTVVPRSGSPISAQQISCRKLAPLAAGISFSAKAPVLVGRGMPGR